jgi:hypothetical protein
VNVLVTPLSRASETRHLIGFSGAQSAEANEF